jgi:hypothetical protein
LVCTAVVGVQVGGFVYRLPARYALLVELERHGGKSALDMLGQLNALGGNEALKNFAATHAWLANGLANTKGANGQPLNRSAVLDALVQQAIRQAAQQPPPPAKPPAPVPEKAAPAK